MKQRKTRSRCSCGFDFTAEKNRHRRVCGDCGQKRVPKSRPKHLVALELPYATFVARNGGVERCGICDAEPKPGRRLHRDHDHRTGLPRAVLCFRCNAALRPYMTVEWLRSAVAYLERNNQEAA